MNFSLYFNYLRLKSGGNFLAVFSGHMDLDLIKPRGRS